jgi:hypothetical protein
MCTVGRGMRVRSCDMVDTEVLTHDVCVGEAKEARLTNKESVSESFPLTWDCLLLFAVNNVVVRELVPSLPCCLLCCISYDKLTKNIPIKIGHTPFASHWLSTTRLSCDVVRIYYAPGGHAGDNPYLIPVSLTGS